MFMAIVIAPSAVVAPPAIVAMEPGSRAKKHAARKIIGAVVSVRRAVIRSVPVISIRANRRRTNIFRLDVCWAGIDRANPDSHPHLRIRRTGRYRNNSQQHHVL
jgi:hypothetical protein